MRAHVKAAEAFERADVPVGARRASASLAEGQDYKVELIDDLVAGSRPPRIRCRPSRCTPTARSPTSAAVRTRRARRRVGAFKLQSVAGAYWRGDSTRTMLTRIYGTAFFSKAELERAPRADRAGQGARPPQARARARPVHVLRASRRAPPSGCPPARACGTRSSSCRARWAASAATREVKTPHHLRRRAVEDLRPLGQVQRAHVHFTDVEDREMGAQADELPGAHARCSRRAPLLPRPARALLRGRACCTATSPRGVLHGLLRVRHIAQDDAPHLLHRGAGRRRRSSGCLEMAFATYELFGFERAPRALDAPGAADRQRRDVGPRRGASSPSALDAAGPRSTS